MTILVITTGGTIGALAYDDPARPPAFSTMPPEGVDTIRDALARQFAETPTRCAVLEPRDSKDIDARYLDQLLHALDAADATRILVTHGTDRMLQTADYLYQRNAALRGKTIVLTGAMVPLANGPESDGYKNLAFALDYLGRAEAEAGIFIVLCDHEDPDTESGAWLPCLYAYQPGAYEKVYKPDARYNRLRRV